MENAKTERDLVIEYRDASKQHKKSEEEAKAASKLKEKAQFALIEYLEDKGAKSTAKYQGIGCVTLVKPRLYAQCNKEHEKKLFAFLKEQHREDLIKTSVHGGSLSSFIKECLGEGLELPEFIKYHLKSTVRLTEDKNVTI